MKRIFALSKFSVILGLSFLIFSQASAQSIWRGLVVAPENRCSPYDKKSQYPYPQSVEDKIVASMDGNVYGPYTGRYFVSDTETDIEHIVAASEGHDSGLCAATEEIRVQFATDLLNLTLAAPEVNRCSSKGKCGLDPAEWMPEKNKCWYANRVIEIKTKYKLSVDQNEADTLESVLANCESVEMIYFQKNEGNEEIQVRHKEGSALSQFDDNNNGRITCSEARAHGIAPVLANHPAYTFMNDRDGDGIACE